MGRGSQLSSFHFLFFGGSDKPPGLLLQYLLFLKTNHQTWTFKVLDFRQTSLRRRLAATVVFGGLLLLEVEEDVGGDGLVVVEAS